MEDEVIGEIAPTFLERLLRELRLAGNVGHNVDEAADSLSVLLAAKKDLSDAMEMSPQQMRPEQVENWFKSVDDVNEQMAEVQREYEKRCMCMGYCSPNIFSSYAISRRASQMLERVGALRREHDSVKNLTVENMPASCIRKPVADVFVGKSPALLAELLSYLDSDDEAAGIISICGMAGVGKSELMRRLNNQFLPVPGTKKAEVFKFVIWVDNADSSDVSAVQDEIAKRLKLGDLGPAAEDGDAEARAGPIFSVLKDASFLVLLDNLMDSVELAAIGIPNPVYRRSACKQRVVLTTRFKSVCGPMNSCHRIDMECLDRDASWELFTASVGGEQIKGRERLGRLVANACGGLPIALDKIGRDMSTKLQPADWRRTAEFLKSSRIHEIPGMEMENTELLEDLKRSYDRGVFNGTHKKCFLCCALWPRGGSISKAELVDCWIGLGLIREHSHDHSFQHGLSIISSLQEANLLLPGEDARHQVKLQEVVRDMALWVARDRGREESKWVVQAGVSLSAFDVVRHWERAATQKSERVSLMQSSIEELPESNSTYPSLALLMLQHNPKFTTISGAFLGSASALAYLDLSHTALEQLPEELGTLVMLEYLNLSFTQLKTLPGGLRNLGRLKLLFLRHTTQLSTIPVDVFRGLTSIRVIDMYPSRYMDWEEGVIGPADGTAVFAFEGIMTFIHSLGITTNSIATVQRLGRLMNVCTRRLLITRFDDDCPPSVTLCPSGFKDLMGSFSLLETLLQLSVTECHTLEQLVLDGEEQQGDPRTRNDSWCLPNLVLLELCGLTNLAAIIWKNMSVSFFLGALLRVKIENCGRLTNVSWVIQLPCLQYLELRDCATMESVVDADQEQTPAFENLMTMVLENLPQLSSICTKQVSFPGLESIQVDRCDKLKVDPTLHRYFNKTRVV